MKFVPIYLLLLTSIACSQVSTVNPEVSLQLADQLHLDYEQYRDTSIFTRRFTLADIEPSINHLSSSFRVNEAGRSVEDRPINRVVWGEGPKQVLLWSQMHGDE
ncbi:MAG: hypothetical protein AAFY41_11805, partial [Bacteroidota bacterium]